MGKNFWISTCLAIGLFCAYPFRVNAQAEVGVAGAIGASSSNEDCSQLTDPNQRTLCAAKKQAEADKAAAELDAIEQYGTVVINEKVWLNTFKESLCTPFFQADKDKPSCQWDMNNVCPGYLKTQFINVTTAKENGCNKIDNDNWSCTGYAKKNLIELNKKLASAMDPNFESIRQDMFKECRVNTDNNMKSGSENDTVVINEKVWLNTFKESLCVPFFQADNNKPSCKLYMNVACPTYLKTQFRNVATAKENGCNEMDNDNWSCIGYAKKNLIELNKKLASAMDPNFESIRQDMFKECQVNSDNKTYNPIPQRQQDSPNHYFKVPQGPHP